VCDRNPVASKSINEVPVAARLGHCWGARPSRWPFPASRHGRDGALRRPPARAFLSPAGRQKFRWPTTGKRQRGHRSAMSLPKRQRAGALQDASRGSEVIGQRASVLECGGPPPLFHRAPNPPTISNTLHPRSSTPNCHWPVLAHGHQLGLCWGARPSRLPFPASRPLPLKIAQPFMAGFTVRECSKSRQGRKKFSAVPRGTF
jgi:hypothetical protein